MRTYLVAAVAFFLILGTGFAFVTSIHAPAVIITNNTGVLTVISLNLTPGNGKVVILGPPSVGASTYQSAEEAVNVATSYLNVDKNLYNFTFTIKDNNISVSGPSGGTAFTLLTIAALDHKPLLNNFTVSGTISSNGEIGLIGGVYDKASAAARAHMKFFLLPNATSGGILEELIYYVAQNVLEIPIVEVNNITQAIPYAFGTKAPVPYSLNFTQHYHLSSMPSFNLTCSNCNVSRFSQLVNYTLNFTSKEIESFPSNFSEAKQQMLGNQERYEEIESKGYGYSAADFAFLQFLQAFVLANKDNYSLSGAQSVLANVSNYCSSLQTPLVNNKNYEYVVGGEFRQYLANQALSEAGALINSSNTTDGYIEGLYYVAQADGWCRASQSLYDIASQINGTYVSFSPQLEQDAYALLTNASKYGASIYLQAAEKAFKDGNYPVALYGAAYAYALDNPYATSNLTNAQIANLTLSNINKSVIGGIWSYEFAAQAAFYLNEYKLGNESDLVPAYMTSLLARELVKVNGELSSSFEVPSVTAPVSPALLSQIQSVNETLLSISQDIKELFGLLIIVFILLFAILVVLLILLANYGKTSARHRAARANERETRETTEPSRGRERRR